MPTTQVLELKRADFDGDFGELPRPCMCSPIAWPRSYVSPARFLPSPAREAPHYILRIPLGGGPPGRGDGRGAFNLLGAHPHLVIPTPQAQARTREKPPVIIDDSLQPPTGFSPVVFPPILADLYKVRFRML